MRAIINNLNDKHQHLKSFSDQDTPRYQGNLNGLIIRALYLYYQATKEKWAFINLENLLENFKHTTEGTWNHWSNSVIGVIIANKLNYSVNANINWHKDLRSLLSQIVECEGRIPYIMNKNDERWPLHKKSYQGYDLYLLLRIADIHPMGMAICLWFKPAFKWAKEYNHSIYRGRNMMSALLAHQLCNLQTKDYIIQTLNKYFLRRNHKGCGEREVTKLLGELLVLSAGFSYFESEEDKSPVPQSD